MSARLRSAAAALARLAAALIAAAPLSVVDRVERPGGVVFRKRRSRHAGLLALMAREAGARFVLLPAREWHVWEAAVYRQVYGAAVISEPDGALCVPALPGEQLAVLLADPARGWEVQRAALAAAVAALRDLHQVTIALPGGERRFSHGDATARNVLYDPAEGRARWFDFETAHPPGRTHAWRRADDLRALLLSAAGCVGERRAPELAQVAATAYPHPETLAELRAIVRRLHAWPDPFHLAQAGDGPAQRALAAALEGIAHDDHGNDACGQTESW